VYTCDCVYVYTIKDVSRQDEISIYRDTITYTYTQSHIHTKANSIRTDIHNHIYTQRRIRLVQIYTIVCTRKGEFTSYRYTQSREHTHNYMYTQRRIHLVQIYTMICTHKGEFTSYRHTQSHVHIHNHINTQRRIYFV